MIHSSVFYGLCVEGHSQTQALQWKTAIYFHAVYLPNLQFQAVQLCEQLFFFPPKAKYEQYQDHICFYGSLGSHIHILCHYMAQ